MVYDDAHIFDVLGWDAMALMDALFSGVAAIACSTGTGVWVKQAAGPRQGVNKITIATSSESTQCL